MDLKNVSKQDVRKQLIKYCKNAQRIFILLGMDKEFIHMLEPNTQVYSAEKDLSTYKLQTRKDLNIHLRYGKASKILFSMPLEYDFIWLDFYGSAMDGQNLEALIYASKRIRKEGVIAVTSRIARQHSNLQHTYMFKKLGFKVIDYYRYMNNRCYMRVFILK